MTGNHFAYADPPYPGCAGYYSDDPNSAEVSLPILIGTLDHHYPDGWALSSHVPALAEILSITGPDVHVGVWCKRNAKPYGGHRRFRAWEPVVFRGGRTRGRPQIRDWVDAPIPNGFMGQREPGPAIVGKKPQAFCFWVLSMLGFRSGDTIQDLFPGSGSMLIAADRVSTEQDWTS